MSPTRPTRPESSESVNRSVNRAPESVNRGRDKCESSVTTRQGIVNPVRESHGFTLGGVPSRRAIHTTSTKTRQYKKFLLLIEVAPAITTVLQQHTGPVVSVVLASAVASKREGRMFMESVARLANGLALTGTQHSPLHVTFLGLITQHLAGFYVLSTLIGMMRLFVTDSAVVRKRSLPLTTPAFSGQQHHLISMMLIRASYAVLC
ncbi:hypothetical protein EI94DRAFT_1212759 [Lactarius quietus]|nr:hypothetical protein EI94DRAFT_1212759 [Lactarius quietus]